MKKIYQSEIDGGRGDCTAACFASILERDVPNFHEPVPALYYPQMFQWLESNNLNFIEMDLTDNYNKDGTIIDDILGQQLRWFGVNGAYCVLSVPSQKFEGGWHHIVGQCFYESQDGKTGKIGINIIHDPNPENTPYDVYSTIARSIGFLIPKFK
jgi:hypothetical protein